MNQSAVDAVCPDAATEASVCAAHIHLDNSHALACANLAHAHAHARTRGLCIRRVIPPHTHRHTGELTSPYGAWCMYICC